MFELLPVWAVNLGVSNVLTVADPVRFLFSRVFESTVYSVACELLIARAIPYCSAGLARHRGFFVRREFVHPGERFGDTYTVIVLSCLRMFLGFWPHSRRVRLGV